MVRCFQEVVPINACVLVMSPQGVDWHRVCSNPVFGFPLVASDFTSCTHLCLRIHSGGCGSSSSPGTVYMTWYILTSCFECLPPDRLFSAVWLLCFGLHLSSSSLSCRRSVIRSRNFGCPAFGPSTRVRSVGDVCHVFQSPYRVRGLISKDFPMTGKCVSPSGLTSPHEGVFLTS